MVNPRKEIGGNKFAQRGLSSSPTTRVYPHASGALLQAQQHRGRQLWFLLTPAALKSPFWWNICHGKDQEKKSHLNSGCKIFHCDLTESVQVVIRTWFCFCPTSLDEREAFPGPLSRRRVKPCTRGTSRTSFLPPHFKCT